MKTPDEIKKGIIDCMDEAIVVSESGDAHDLLNFSDKAHVCMAVTLTYIQQLERELEAVKQDGCDFCKTFDFSSVRTEVTKRAAHISLALGNTTFYGDGRFKYCPMCGKLLSEPPKGDDSHE